MFKKTFYPALPSIPEEPDSESASEPKKTYTLPPLILAKSFKNLPPTDGPLAIHSQKLPPIIPSRR